MLVKSELRKLFYSCLAGIPCLIGCSGVEDGMSGEGESVGEPEAFLAAAAARPAFQLPFGCGESWRLDSWGHAPALDLVRDPDQAGTEGALLVAPADGVVNQSFFHQNAGNLIQINHGWGWFTTSIHLQSRSVSAGQAVRQGQAIGRVGHTGPTSNGHPHLHFEQAYDANNDGKASWGASNTERVVQVFNGVSYGTGNNQTYRRVVSRNCGAAPTPTGSAKRHDVNGDGRADLVSVSDDGSAVVWPGQADGRFGTAVSSFAGSLNGANVDGTGHYIVGVADVNGDRRADLVSAWDEGSAVVWPGQADGRFGIAVTSFAGSLNAANVDGTGHFIVGVADVTGDGRADLVSAADDGNAVVWPGQADGRFGTAVSSFAGSLNAANEDGTGHYIVGLADVTGDGRADLVSAWDEGSAVVWPGQADGRFGTAVTSFAGSLNAANVDGTGHSIVGVSDVTGDGRADLVSAWDEGSAVVWPGQADGRFGTAVTSFAGSLDAANVDGTGHYIIGVADVTGDGRADLVSAWDVGSAVVWPGQADGRFGTAVISFAGSLNAANVDGTGHYLISPAVP